MSRQRNFLEAITERKIPITCRYWSDGRCFKSSDRCTYLHGYLCRNDGDCRNPSCSNIHLKQRDSSHSRHRKYSRSRSRSISPRFRHRRNYKSPPRGRNRNYGPSRSRSRSPRRRNFRSRSKTPKRRVSRSPRRYSRSRTKSPRHRSSRSYSRGRSRSPQFERRSPVQYGDKSPSPPARKLKDSEKDSCSSETTEIERMGSSHEVDSVNVDEIIEEPRKEVSRDSVEDGQILSPEQYPECVCLDGSGDEQTCSTDEEVEVLTCAGTSSKISKKDTVRMREPSISELTDHIASEFMKPETQALLQNILKLTSDDESAKMAPEHSTSPDPHLTEKILEEMAVDLEEVGEEVDDYLGKAGTELRMGDQMKNAANPSPPKAPVPNRRKDIRLPADYHTDWELKMALEDPKRPLEKEVSVPFRPPPLQKDRGKLLNSSTLWTPALDRRQVAEAKMQQKYQPGKSNWEVETPYIARNAKKEGAQMEQPFTSRGQGGKPSQMEFSHPVVKQGTKNSVISSKEEALMKNFLENAKKNGSQVEQPFTSRGQSSKPSQMEFRQPVSSQGRSSGGTKNPVISKMSSTEGKLPCKEATSKSRITEKNVISAREETSFCKETTSRVTAKTDVDKYMGENEIKSSEAMENLIKQKTTLLDEIKTLESQRSMLQEQKNNMVRDHKGDKESLEELLTESNFLHEKIGKEITKRSDKVHKLNVSLILSMKKNKGHRPDQDQTSSPESSDKQESSSDEDDRFKPKEIGTLEHIKKYLNLSKNTNEQTTSSVSPEHALKSRSSSKRKVGCSSSPEHSSRIKKRFPSPDYSSRNKKTYPSPERNSRSRKKSPSPEYTSRKRKASPYSHKSRRSPQSFRSIKSPKRAVGYSQSPDSDQKRSMSPESSKYKQLKPTGQPLVKIQKAHWARSHIMGTLNKFKRDLFAEVDVSLTSGKKPKSQDENIDRDESSDAQLLSSKETAKETSKDLKKNRADDSLGLKFSVVNEKEQAAAQSSSLYSETSTDGNLVERSRLPVDSQSQIQYRYIDVGDHWCTLCDLVFEKLPMYCKHLLSSSHLSKLKNNPKPWLAKAAKQEKKALLLDVKTIPTPMLGTEFLHSMPAVYCSLCDTFLRDVAEAVKHPECDTHIAKYKAYKETNPRKIESYWKAHAGALSRQKFVSDTKDVTYDVRSDVSKQIEERLLREIKAKKERDSKEKSEKVKGKGKDAEYKPSFVSVRVASREQDRELVAVAKEMSKECNIQDKEISENFSSESSSKECKSQHKEDREHSKGIRNQPKEIHGKTSTASKKPDDGNEIPVAKASAKVLEDVNVKVADKTEVKERGDDEKLKSTTQDKLVKENSLGIKFPLVGKMPSFRKKVNNKKTGIWPSREPLSRDSKSPDGVRNELPDLGEKVLFEGKVARDNEVSSHDRIRVVSEDSNLCTTTSGLEANQESIADAKVTGYVVDDTKITRESNSSLGANSMENKTLQSISSSKECKDSTNPEQDAIGSDMELDEDSSASEREFELENIIIPEGPHQETKDISCSKNEISDSEKPELKSDEKESDISSATVEALQLLNIPLPGFIPSKIGQMPDSALSDPNDDDDIQEVIEIPLPPTNSSTKAFESDAVHSSSHGIQIDPEINSFSHEIQEEVPLPSHISSCENKDLDTSNNFSHEIEMDAGVSYGSDVQNKVTALDARCIDVPYSDNSLLSFHCLSRECTPPPPGTETTSELVFMDETRNKTPPPPGTETLSTRPGTETLHPQPGTGTLPPRPGIGTLPPPPGTETLPPPPGTETLPPPPGTETYPPQSGTEILPPPPGTETWSPTPGTETWPLPPGTETLPPPPGTETWPPPPGTETLSILESHFEREPKSAPVTPFHEFLNSVNVKKSFSCPERRNSSKEKLLEETVVKLSLPSRTEGCMSGSKEYVLEEECLKIYAIQKNDADLEQVDGSLRDKNILLNEETAYENIVSETSFTVECSGEVSQEVNHDVQNDSSLQKQKDGSIRSASELLYDDDCDHLTHSGAKIGNFVSETSDDVCGSKILSQIIPYNETTDVNDSLPSLSPLDIDTSLERETLSSEATFDEEYEEKGRFFSAQMSPCVSSPKCKIDSADKRQDCLTSFKEESGDSFGEEDIALSHCKRTMRGIDKRQDCLTSLREESGTCFVDEDLPLSHLRRTMRGIDRRQDCLTSLVEESVDSVVEEDMVQSHHRRTTRGTDRRQDCPTSWEEEKSEDSGEEDKVQSHHRRTTRGRRLAVLVQKMKVSTKSSKGRPSLLQQKCKAQEADNASSNFTAIDSMMEEENQTLITDDETSEASSSSDVTKNVENMPDESIICTVRRSVRNINSEMSKSDGKNNYRKEQPSRRSSRTTKSSAESEKLVMEELIVNFDEESKAVENQEVRSDCSEKDEVQNLLLETSSDRSTKSNLTLKRSTRRAAAAACAAIDAQLKEQKY